MSLPPPSNSAAENTSYSSRNSGWYEVIVNPESEYVLLNHANNKGSYIPNTYNSQAWPHRSAGSRIIETSLRGTPHSAHPRVIMTKNRRFVIFDGLVIDVTGDPTILYALLIPKTHIKNIELEIAINSIIGSKSFDLPTGTILYEHRLLMQVSGVYNSIRLSYSKLIRSVFDEDSITSDPAVIRNVILPKIPRNLGLSQMKTILDKANATIGAIR